MKHLVSWLAAAAISAAGLTRAVPTYISPAPQETSDCASFAASLPLPANVTLLSSSSLPQNAFSNPNFAGTNSITFCRVVGEAPYAVNDTVGFELWLPENGAYNGRYVAVGNGGLAGYIDYTAMLLQLNAGFAVAGGDGGHLIQNNGFGITEPGQSIPFLQSKAQTLAWQHNSIATFAAPTQQLTTRYYTQKPVHAYYSGCSTGGAQGFALAQFYPTLFDGIYAGSPGNWYSHLILSFLWGGLRTQGDAFMDQATLDFITAAVVAECDGHDGVLDGVIENPLACTFNISSLACPSGTSTSSNATTCLTPAQIAAVDALYAGPKNTRDGSQIYPGLVVGSENTWIQQEQSLYINYSVPILQNLVIKNLSYDYTSFDFGADVDTVNHVASPLIDEISPDLSAFRKRGGKLIVTQGWTDPFNSPLWPIEHRQQLQKSMGGDISDFFSLFMVPGGGHCGAVEQNPQVPASYQVLQALVPWVEAGTRPASVLSTSPPDGSNRTRTLCPYPQVAVYHGGNQDDASSFKCSN